MQWSNVLRAIRQCGSYRTPTFKDPYTAAVISTIGWQELCGLSEDRLEWKAKEFVNAYRDYQMRPIEYLPDHIKGREDIQQARLADATQLQKITNSVLKTH